MEVIRDNRQSILFYHYHCNFVILMYAHVFLGTYLAGRPMQACPHSFNVKFKGPGLDFLVLDSDYNVENIEHQL